MKAISHDKSENTPSNDGPKDLFGRGGCVVQQNDLKVSTIAGCERLWGSPTDKYSKILPYAVTVSTQPWFRWRLKYPRIRTHGTIPIREKQISFPTLVRIGYFQCAARRKTEYRS